LLVLDEEFMQGTMGLWAEPFTALRLQKIFNLMQDPFERADITSNTSGIGSLITWECIRDDG